MSRRLPAVKPREVLRGLRRAGFFVHHTSGSHHVLKHPGKLHLRVTLPFHNKDLKRRTLARSSSRLDLRQKNSRTCSEISRKVTALARGEKCRYIDCSVPARRLRVAAPPATRHQKRTWSMTNTIRRVRRPPGRTQMGSTARTTGLLPPSNLMSIFPQPNR